MHINILNLNIINIIYLSIIYIIYIILLFQNFNLKTICINFLK